MGGKETPENAADPAPGGCSGDAIAFVPGAIAGGLAGLWLLQDTTKVTGDIPSIGMGLTIFVFVAALTGGAAAVAVRAVRQAATGKGSKIKAAIALAVLALLGVQCVSVYIQVQQVKAKVLNEMAENILRDCTVRLEAFFPDHTRYPATLAEAGCRQEEGVVLTAVKMTKDAFIIMSYHTQSPIENMVRSDKPGLFTRERDSGQEWKQQ